MRTPLKDIAPFVRDQFPDFYKEDGDNFLQFVKAYYEWMDSQGPIYKTRNLNETTDIDETANAYVNYFMEKYMHGIPKSIVADKKLLEKHITNFYRSKNSIESLRLLFRILYNLDIDVYVPQIDMLRTSYGSWQKRKYLEVTQSLKHFEYDNQYITGTQSGASAYVSSACRFNLTGQDVYILYITDLKEGPTGQLFLPGEQVIYDNLQAVDAATILGSAVGADVIASTEDNAIGDILATTNPTGQNLKFAVKEIIDPELAKGYISFKIVDGGNGFALDSPVTITYGTATTGIGANFKVGSLSNTSLFTFNTNLLAPEMSTAINAIDYGANLNFCDVNSILFSALTDTTITVGTIASLAAVTSGNRQYNGSVNPKVYEARTRGYGIIGQNGGLWGDNAIITGYPASGNGIISAVSLVSSGFGFNLQGEKIQFYNQSNTNYNADLSINIGGVGEEEGEWLDEQGFLNSNKFIQDSYYYQEYSYEIQVEKSFDKYIDILKKLVHPVGNRVFGKPLIIDLVTKNQSVVLDSVDSGKNIKLLCEVPPSLTLVVNGPKVVLPGYPAQGNSLGCNGNNPPIVPGGYYSQDPTTLDPTLGYYLGNDWAFAAFHAGLGLVGETITIEFFNIRETSFFLGTTFFNPNDPGTTSYYDKYAKIFRPTGYPTAQSFVAPYNYKYYTLSSPGKVCSANIRRIG